MECDQHCGKHIADQKWWTVFLKLSEQVHGMLKIVEQSLIGTNWDQKYGLFRDRRKCLSRPKT